MDDLGAAIQSFLSQPGAMEQVEAMARQLGLDPTGENADAGEPEMPGLSPELLGALSGAIRQASEPSRETALLEALRPMLRPEKRDKVDRALRAVRIARTARMLTGTGLMEKLL